MNKKLSKSIVTDRSTTLIRRYIEKKTAIRENRLYQINTSRHKILVRFDENKNITYFKQYEKNMNKSRRTCI